MNNKGKLYGVGIGPGDAELLTLKAINALKKADIICLPKSKQQASTALEIVADYLPSNIEQVQMVFSMSKDIEQRIASRKENATKVMELLETGKNVVFLTLGDPMLYSTYSYLLEYLDEKYSVENIPGIYSFAAISNSLSIPLCKGSQNISVIGAFDQESEQILKLSATTVCMKVSSYGKQLAQFLKANTNYTFAMISEAGKMEENRHFDIKILEEELPYFSTAIIQKR